MAAVIKVENLSKQYRLGKIGTGSLSHDLNRWWHSIRGKEDPYLQIGETNDRSKKGESEYVWSLRDLNFEIEQGDAVGIIGRNGAGKSTLLKILSRVTGPTTGNLKVKGRIASLLEVGTGFHPELSGKENIYLNGAILGMRKHEIQRKLDEIIDFSGVERYIDTPVKRYSSGMYVRLAFAVAAHLESEILIVDEVLAVGDAEFQKKCLGKMNDVSKGEGRTILFVSHNLGSVQKLCNNGILLNNGVLQACDNMENIINLYTRNNTEENAKHISYENNLTKSIAITEVGIFAEKKNADQAFDITDELKVKINYAVNNTSKGTSISFSLLKDGIVIFRSWDIDNNRAAFIKREKGLYTTLLEIPNEYLTPGTYSIHVTSSMPNVGRIDVKEDCLVFEIENIMTDISQQSFSRGGLIKANLLWNTQKIN